MTTFAPGLSLPNLSVIPKLIPMIPFKHPRADTRGSGYLAGEFPAGITTVEGVPASAQVRVLLRAADGSPADGDVVATTMSATDGTWRVEGLDTTRRYDVVGRKDGFNDVIVSNVKPVG